LRGLLARLNLASVTHSLTGKHASKIKFLGAVTTGGQPAWLLQDQVENSIYVAAHSRPLQIAGPPPPSVQPRQLRG
jgi:hypothetical protein